MKIFSKLFFPIIIFCCSFTADEKVIYSSKGIQISYKKSECKLDNSFDQDWFLLKISNSTGKNVKVSYKVNLYNQNNECVNCSSQEDTYSIEIKAGQSLEGFCDFKCPRALRIVSKLNDVATKDHYPSFKLENITITE
jgi:hypothetical protein